jgi:2-polyprenyl-3-methyl-5-hydroxy-6-metoxy-1,4-benzoquinol methylase
MTFEEFRKLAQDRSLSRHERIGFPDSYREGYDAAIMDDILAKLPRLTGHPAQVVDIGPGAGDLAFRIIDHCKGEGHHLTLIDSAEMLGHIEDSPLLTKVAGRFPEESGEFIARARGKFDVVLVYSVLHYVFEEGNVLSFLDAALSLLAEGGQLLIGDIPNHSKRVRFFSSEAGVRFHQEFTGTDTLPEIPSNADGKSIDDKVIMSMLARARDAGYDAYVVPQRPELPMANRREDFLAFRN